VSDKRKTAKQCKTCPWRVDVVPPRDVPNYDPGIYARMRATLRSGFESMSDKTRIVMKCHNGRDNVDVACAGWLHHQIGVGNNLGVRFAVILGKLPVPKVIGDQHEDLDALPEDV